MGLTETTDFCRRGGLLLTLAALLCIGIAGCQSPDVEVDHSYAHTHDSAAVPAAEGDLGAQFLSDDRGVPRIHQQHIFFGDINHRGEAVGFHYRASGESSGRARLVPGTQSAADRRGVYQARVEIMNPHTGEWVKKTAWSSFYPDSWTPRQVLAEIRSAWNNRVNKGPDKTDFEGVSTSGVRIFGYLATDHSIFTAFPLKGR